MSDIENIDTIINAKRELVTSCIDKTPEEIAVIAANLMLYSSEENFDTVATAIAYEILVNGSMLLV